MPGATKLALVGATLTGDGTAVAGAADGTFEVTITYQ
jgi:hypothetical protein